MITILLMFFEHVLITLPSSNSISTDFTIFYFPIPNSIPIYIFSELISPILSHCNYTQSNLYKMNTLGTSQKWSSWASGCPLKHLNKKNFMTSFYGWDSTASRLQPLREGSLRFTIQFPEIPDTHFFYLGRMKGWVNLGATHWFWT